MEAVEILLDALWTI